MYHFRTLLSISWHSPSCRQIPGGAVRPPVHLRQFARPTAKQTRAFCNFPRGPTSNYQKATHSKERFNLYVKGYPFFAVVPLLISPPKTEFHLNSDCIPGLDSPPIWGGIIGVRPATHGDRALRRISAFSAPIFWHAPTEIVIRQNCGIVSCLPPQRHRQVFGVQSSPGTQP